LILCRIVEQYLCTPLRGLFEDLVAQTFQFGDFTLDQSRYRLQRGERALPPEKHPMELLILLVERRGELISREEIAERLWGKDVFLDVDHGINTAVRKVRQVLHVTSQQPRKLQHVRRNLCPREGSLVLPVSGHRFRRCHHRFLVVSVP
jgi:hypothetical protein